METATSTDMKRNSLLDIGTIPLPSPLFSEADECDAQLHREMSESTSSHPSSPIEPDREAIEDVHGSFEDRSHLNAVPYTAGELPVGPAHVIVTTVSCGIFDPAYNLVTSPPTELITAETFDQLVSPTTLPFQAPTRTYPVMPESAASSATYNDKARQVYLLIAELHDEHDTQVRSLQRRAITTRTKLSTVIKNPNNRITHLEGQVTRLETDKINLKDENTTLVNSESALERQVTALTDEVSALTDNVAMLTSDKTSLTEQVTTLTKNVTTLTDQVTTLTNEKATLASEKIALTDEKTALTNDKTALTSALSTKTTKAAKLLAAVDKMHECDLKCKRKREEAWEELDDAADDLASVPEGSRGLLGQKAVRRRTE